MNFIPGAVAGTGSYTENVKRTHISDLHCTGNEDTLFDCSHNVINNYCATYNDAYVTCTGQKKIKLYILLDTINSFIIIICL